MGCHRKKRLRRSFKTILLKGLWQGDCCSSAPSKVGKMSTLRKEEALINQSVDDGLKLFAKLSFIKPAIVRNRRGYYYDYLFICFACSWLIEGASFFKVYSFLFEFYPYLDEDLRTFSFTTWYRTTHNAITFRSFCSFWVCQNRHDDESAI